MGAGAPSPLQQFGAICRDSLGPAAYPSQLEADAGKLGEWQLNDNAVSAMMLDWSEYRKQLAAGIREIGQLSPDTIGGYVELS
jgi:hypothetical protein